jgi:hypothetical protein
MLAGLPAAWLAGSAMAVFKMISVHFRLTLTIQSCNFFRNHKWDKKWNISCERKFCRHL